MSVSCVAAVAPFQSLSHPFSDSPKIVQNSFHGATFVSKALSKRDDALNALLPQRGFLNSLAR
eukprot:1185847-Amphidinium_carterae.1